MADKNRTKMLTDLFVARVSLNFAQANAPNGSELQKAIHNLQEDVQNLLDEIKAGDYNEEGAYV